MFHPAYPPPEGAWLATPLAVMAARRDSKIVLLSFSGEAKVVFDIRFASEDARVRGVHVLEGVQGLKVTPYDSSVWVTVLHLPMDMSEQVVVRTLGRFGKVNGYEEPEFLEYRSYAARVATGVAEAVLVPASDTVPPDAPLIAQCPTLAPGGGFVPPFVSHLVCRDCQPAHRGAAGQNGGYGTSRVACGAGCRLYWFTGSYARYR
ncbi:hypothetical protein BSL78_16702 [Apostichopus japonicus]|uniref:Uncharacterized protein n=1 Tax=Stichopus japonicus TaxID=307972 RepID=A0A2G8KEQ9_STIJA|nr:hypothetical protein BSL78_16702 [Apostichopus japonicus]